VGVMLDTSALIGLHEAAPEVRTFLAGVLEQHDDGSTPKVHAVTLGELWTGVLAVGAPDDPANPRTPVLETALRLDVETIDADDAATFAALTRATNRAMSHNDRWICAAAIRTRTTLITQDESMAVQLERYFRSLDLIDALRSYVRVVYVPRDPAILVDTEAAKAVNVFRSGDEIAHLMSLLDPREAEVLKLRFGLDRGEPRTLQEVGDQLGLKPARIAQIEKRAIAHLRAETEDG
jgi:RNA polymerase sigma factor (sigma-70 family)